MINEEMLAYVRQQLAQGSSKDTIRATLTSEHGGWHHADVDEAFQSLGLGAAPVPQAPAAAPVPQYQSAQYAAPAFAPSPVPSPSPAPAPTQQPVYAQPMSQPTAGGVTLTPTFSNVEYAGFWIRFLAQFLDTFIVGIPIFILSAFVFQSIFALEDLQKLGVRLFVSFFHFSLFYSYVIATTYFTGGTLGKRIFGIHVVSERSQTLSFWQTVLRELFGKTLSAMTLCIGYLMIAFSDRKRALHDMVAGTVVVYKDPTRAATINRRAAIAGWILLVLVIVLPIIATVLLASLSAARKKSEAMQKVTANENQLEILKQRDADPALPALSSIDTGSYALAIPDGWQQASRPVADGSQEIVNTNTGYDFLVQEMPLPAGTPEKVTRITDAMSLGDLAVLIKRKYPSARISKSIVGAIGGQKAVVTAYSASDQIQGSGGGKKTIPFSAVQYGLIYKNVFYTITIRSAQDGMNIADVQAVIDGFVFK